MSTTAPAAPAQPDTTIVDEIPETLNHILLLVVKNFFTNEHFLVVYYIMRAECIREENLRSRLNFDQKQLRQLLANLKGEKLVKERLLSQKNENGRNVSIIFYFINYRAVLNVLRYKIDHMRQKLESREKDDMNQAHYKCNHCSSRYELLDIPRILDPMTGQLRCWRCHNEVTADESVAPSQLTRTAVARFNEQMTPLFARIQELNGVQLAPHLLEPDINKFLEEDVKNQQQQQMDFTSAAPRAQLGGSAHSFAATINYAHGDQITVDLNADINKKQVEEAKEVPLWLQDDAIGGTNGLGEAEFGEKVVKEAEKGGLSLHMLAEIEGVEAEPTSAASNGEPEAKKLKEDEEEEDEDEEEEELVDVGDRKVPLSDVTPEMVENGMNDLQRQAYTDLIQQHMAY
ncbi:unnamed protein product [Caenorhabditis auriculariae]|uniref:HTH TFE/IIEalpha-type domain-containing protein n=1 Tax=Caenorhabditis auriculariae TaxID=2777116 RepID=A0A8S1HRB3_9PELO|nr:unnamed protein product [Caenorhabditis auriculariae]